MGIINMKKLSFYLIVALLPAFLITSCNTEKKKYPDFNYTKSGLAYKFHTQNPEGEVPDAGKLIKVVMTYGTNDTIFFNTDIIPGGTLTLPMTESSYDGDLFEAIAMMRTGDSATFIMEADSFFLKTAHFPEIPEYAKDVEDLIFNIRLDDVMTEEEARKDYEDQLGKLKEEEQLTIQKYIEDNNIKIKPTPTGLYFENVKKGKGPFAKNGDLVSVNFTIKFLDSTQIFSTIEAGEPVLFELRKPYDTEGMNEALRMMRVGGKANLIMPSSLAFGERGRGDFIPPYSPLLCEVELVKIQSGKEYNKQQQRDEVEKINKYISENHIDIKPTNSGLYYIEVEKGTGHKAMPGKKVKVWYTGKLLDGTVFDASEKHNKPFEFVLGQGQVIKGWDEGIAMMNEGGKATLIIPSKLAYGERGSGQFIKPFSPLVFEVELQEVEK